MTGNAELGLKIREMRNSRNLTLSKLTAMTGLTTSFISQVERGLVSPSIDSLRNIGRALGVELVEFFVEGVNTNARSSSGPRRMTTDKETKSTYEEIIFNLRGIRLSPLIIRIEEGGEVKKELLREDCAVFATVTEGQAALIFGNGYSAANTVIGGGTEISWAREKVLLEKSDCFCSIEGKKPGRILNMDNGSTVLLWIRSGTVKQH